MEPPSLQSESFKKCADNSTDESPGFIKQIITEMVYNGWLTCENIANIAEHRYGWHKNNANVMFKVIGFAGNLECELTADKMDKLVSSEKQSLTFIIALLGKHHFAPLVISYQNGAFFAYYIFSYCLDLRNISAVLNKKIPGISIQSFNKSSLDDDHNCGIFALENAKIINDSLKSGQIERTLSSYTRTLGLVQKKQKEFASALFAPYCNKLTSIVGDVEHLLLIIKNTCIDIILDLLSKGMNEATVNSNCLGGWTPLLLAVRSGRLDLVTTLLDQEANVNLGFVEFSGTHSSDSRFNVAHVDIINVIIDRGLEISEIRILSPSLDATELPCYGVKDSHIDVLSALIGEDIRMKKPSPLTPLNLAIRLGHEVIANVLLNRGADIIGGRGNEDDLLHLAITGGHVSTVNALLEENGNQKLLTSLTWAISNGDVDLVNALIQRGADINGRYDDDSITPLLLAVELGHMDIVKVLLQHGADVNAGIRMQIRSLNLRFSYSPLLAAINVDRLDILRAIIDQGANIDGERQGEWVTPLIFALSYKRLDTANYLINMGANVNKCRDGKTALYFVVSIGYIEGVQMLLNRGAYMNDKVLLIAAVENKRTEMVRYLIDMAIVSDKLSSLLIVATSKGYTEIVEILINEGVNVNAKKEDEIENALHIAAANGNLEMVKMLIKEGASVNLADKFGHMPLTRAVDEGQTEIVIYIVNHIGKLIAAGLFVNEYNFRNIKRVERRYQLYHNIDMNNTYNHSLKMHTKKVEQLKQENYSLFQFLTATDVNRLINLWESNESISNLFDDREIVNLKNLYPEYAAILINNANKVKKEIFLHNHKPLINILSVVYKRDISKMEFIGIKNIFKMHKDKIVANFVEIELPLTDFVDFKAKKKNVPRLELHALVQSIGNRLSDENLDNSAVGL